METAQTNITEFSIQGFFGISELRVPVFLLFLFAYLTIISGNLTIVAVIWTFSHLHTPMYSFLANLSILDIASTSCTLPKLLSMLSTKRNTISFTGCITQLYFFLSLSCTEAILLSIMAYDRYVAICNPLHYVVIMKLRYCVVLSLIAWIVAFLDIVGHAVLISKLNFCASHVIDHFFCDLVPVLKMSCSDTYSVELLTYTEGTILGIATFFFTLGSYAFIISTILKIKTSQGRGKAFSTCTGHLTCVTVFYSTLLCLYMRPTSYYSPKHDKFFALLYIVLVPMLNPVIYSLKNEEVKKVFRDFKKGRSLTKEIG
ncbi:olfactory receptor 1G1-like [Pyxicephalus adspersus]|uniref:olfactory receptor 1G1-like n=1 Tax=Pyxicephalus adspersus TaxID=30357 RepID=UPI003B5C2A0A